MEPLQVETRAALVCKDSRCANDAIRSGNIAFPAALRHAFVKQGIDGNVQQTGRSHQTVAGAASIPFHGTAHVFDIVLG